MTLNTYEMWSNGIKIAFFFPKKSQKIGQRLGASPPDPQSLRRLRPRPQTPIRDTFELHLLSQHVPKVRYLHFLTINLSPLPLQILVTRKQATTISDLPSYDIFVPQKLPLWKNFDDVISCDLFFRPPPIKNSGYANKLEIAWKKILKTFFFAENACARVLGPC